MKRRALIMNGSTSRQKGIIQLPPISHDDRTANHIADMLSNGTVVIGETDYLNGANSNEFWNILGHHTLSRLMNIVSAYVPREDLLCKYDLLSFKMKDGSTATFMVISASWKRNKENLRKAFYNELNAYRFLYADPEHRIMAGNNIVDLEYEDIKDHMKDQEHAVFSMKTIEKYKGYKRHEND